MRPLAWAAISAVVFLTDTALAQKAVNCAPDLRAAGLVAVTGSVRDLSSNVVLLGAQVFATLIPPGTERGERFETYAGRGGAFRICLQRTSVPINVHADFFGRTSNILQVRFAEDTDSVVLHLAVVMASRAKVSGRVLDVNSRPVAAAQLTLEWGGYTQISDPQGRFVFPDVPPGRYQLAVSHIGYTTVNDSLLIEPGASLELGIRVAPHAIPLAPLTVTVKSRRLERLGFYERQKVGHGGFLTRTEIAKANPSMPTDILRNLRGVRLNPRATGRGFTVLGRGDCRYRYYVDGIRVAPGFELDDFDWQWIEALEVYRGSADTPPQFNNTVTGDATGCGVIVIWTRTVH